MVSEKQALDPEVRRALTDFYREEFLRHLSHLQCTVVHEWNRAVIERPCDRLLSDLDHVCCRSGFPAVAETLLQSFDALTRLSELDPRRGH